MPPGSDSRPPIRVVRPLRDVGLKECAMWAWWNGLKVPGRDRYPGGKQGIGSITYSESLLRRHGRGILRHTQNS